MNDLDAPIWVTDFYSDEGWEVSLLMEPKTAERSAIEMWYEHFDNHYDGDPLKDYEVEMLRILGKGMV